MKKKDLVSLRKKEIKDLEKMVEEKRAKAINAHVKMQAGQEKNLKKASNLRREIAQILTIIKEKEIREEEMPEAKKKEETK
jgi:ribosomal protein L29